MQRKEFQTHSSHSFTVHIKWRQKKLIMETCGILISYLLQLQLHIQHLHKRTHILNYFFNKNKLISPSMQ